MGRKIEEHPIKFEVVEDGQNCFTFSFINFQNEKFTVRKSDVITDGKKEIFIKIKDANFSLERFEKCIFSTGTITISNLTENNMTLNLKSVGPTCWIMDDVSMNMEDLNNIILTKEKIK